VEQKRVPDPTILAVFPMGEDRRTLEGTLGRAGWQLQFAWGFKEAQAILGACAVAVVISESRLPGGYTWKDVLAVSQSLPSPLIVADRLADERLWAEVLNLGGYDLLSKPLEPAELLHTVSLARRLGQDLTEPADAPQKPLKSEAAGLW
jgi:two-component system, NtrC family, response regulator PilR